MKYHEHPLRVWMVAHGVSMRDMAARLGVRYESLGRYIALRRCPTWPIALRMEAETGGEITASQLYALFHASR